ncbi:YfzA family protein [Lysinibacillus sp. G01H]|uniref:YfzA family protein n=1 Tax=Lysinibacillus sp. G01H TaxID=3026425 RepID=UPI00237E40AC|nr:YfzA family protein [Lysinibacillus sp. G01H]WDU77600.1 YfzA family protein [Lysinibacillus sp. G01H]
MVGTEKAHESNLLKRWIITICIFLIVQLIFITVDGTALEPNMNDSNNLVARMGRWILDSRLFTEWITPYSFPFFNMFITIHVIAILIADFFNDILKKIKKRDWHANNYFEQFKGANL